MKFLYQIIQMLLPIVKQNQDTQLLLIVKNTGADPGFDQIVTGLKLPFWGLSFVEFWCWGLIFGGQGGGPGPRVPPWIRP